MNCVKIIYNLSIRNENTAKRSSDLPCHFSTKVTNLIYNEIIAKSLIFDTNEYLTLCSYYQTKSKCTDRKIRIDLYALKATKLFFSSEDIS